MIGRICGQLLERTPPYLLIDVAGVGYELQSPMSTFYVLPKVGQQVALCTHVVVREDAHLLFGFATQLERRMFRDLLKVSGVGPRIALAILSGISVDALIGCIRADDAATLTRIPGVGRKTAERVVIEMRDRLQAAQMPDGGERPMGAQDPAGAAAEAFSAMLALGYKPAEATRLLRAVPGAEQLQTEELIRKALQGIGGT